VPIYEFSCEACGEVFERLVDAGTESAECPSCGAAGAGRRFSAFAVTTRQLTANQRRRLEDKRGTDRDGARARFKRDLAARRRRAGGGGGKGGGA
jgi:putative FmdB family regulatory protein